MTLEAEPSSERRILALDYGAKRVGVAVSDPTGIVAQPLMTLSHGRRRPPLLEQIAALIEEHHVERVVLGLPLHMDGRQGPEAERVKRLGTKIEARSRVPVAYVDERWTSLAAERSLHEMGLRQRDARRHVDAIAATLVLRTYLAQSAARRAEPDT